MAKLAGLQRSQFQKTDFHAPQLLHQPPEMSEHQPDLVLASFDEPHFIPGIIGLAD
jgi:hypothetical protein